MKKAGILLAVLLVVVGFAAQANAAIIINPASGGEPNLWDISTGWGFTVTQTQLENATTSETLPAGSYTVIDLARYAGNDNDGGFYTGIGSVPAHTATLASISATAEVDPDPNGYNSAVSITFNPTSTFGFYNKDMSNLILGTTQNQNAGSQSNGYIFNLASINPAYAGDYLVAFEDGDGHPPLNDMDYNDLVFAVQVNAVPVPPSLLLFGSGLLGLTGWRWFRKS
ncbi:MAG: hypothetical protein ACLPYB_09820 [Desulfobaccales bacterium]